MQELIYRFKGAKKTGEAVPQMRRRFSILAKIALAKEIR
jgi:hypothetical protein